ncbi:myomegalin isoform 4-T4 [Odontesthes bonariensis]|uniref:myomegalin isoform X1 n=1 Tax=Odontesthes bonariensis TaxID=219752 RepID=UPI003F58AD34
MLDLKMKEACRICARELCGNQRRWIFHPTAKLNLQVLLSHALGQELTRDGKGEFACSKCTFMLDRMYRFDTVIARVEALSIERLQRLLQEKHRLRQCIGGLYRKTNSEEGAGTLTGINEEPGDGMVDISGLTHARYCALLQEDLVYSLYESWADDGPDCHHQHHPQCSAGPGSEATAAGSHRCVPSTPRRCRGCSYWRVADSDYEAVCKVPRKLARSISCGPSTRSSASVIGGSVTGGGGQAEKKHVEDSEEAPSSHTLVPGSQDLSRISDSDRTLAGRVSSSPSVASLETAEEYTHPGTIMDGVLGSPREAIEDSYSDSLSEEHMGAPHGQASPAPSLSLALCLLQSYVAYRPVRSTKGSKLPVLLRRSSTNGGTRPGFPDPVVGMSYGTPEEEKDNLMSTPELDTPLIMLGFGEDQELNLANMDDLLEDLYNEYPPPPPHQNLVEEQQSQLNQYECAAGQCVSELQKAQLQVQSLQVKINKSEANNMKLQEKLSEMECELRSLRQATQSQERTIQGLTESMTTKDSEAQELYQLIEGQNTTLCKLQELAHVNQLAQSKAPVGVSESMTLSQLQSELVGAQSSLFSLGLELEASQRSLSQSQRQGDDLMRFKDRLNSDLQEALQHREVTEKHNQDLQSALQKLRSDLQAKEASLKENETEKHTVIQEKDRSIAQLKCSLQDKEQQLQEYSEMLESTGSSKHRDALLEKLRERIKERDRALERSIDDKFRCLEDRDGQVRTLQLALREKERDLERLRCILTNNEETITSLDALMRGKELELEQAAEAYRNLQWLKQQSQERERNTLREKDTIINQLQAALQTRSQETQDLTAALVARAHAGPTEVVEELKAQLGLKEKLFQELLSDRSRRTNEHQAQVQDLLSTLSSKDQYLQDYSYRLSLVVSERTGQLQELRRQLTQTEQELCELRRDKEREMGGETEHLRGLLKEKEAFIKELIQAQEEAVQPFSKESEAEMKALKDEMQLVLKKEMEAQKELSALRLSLARRQSEGVVTKDSPDHQCVLEQLVAEYNKLNDALRVEKRLYQNMTHFHNSDGKSEKIQALHTELDSVQALRGQLEEVLARTSNIALVLEKAAKRQPDFGELSTEEEEEEEGDDEDGSSDEFTDSIEEDGNNVSSTSLNSIQACAKAEGSERVTAELIGGVFSQKADIKQLEEAKRALEVELEEIKSQLEKDGYTSMAEMRSALQRLQQENQALTERQGWAGAAGLRTKVKKNLNQEEEGSEGADEGLETSPVLSGKRGPPSFSLSNESGKRHCLRPRSLDLPPHQTKTVTDVGPAGGRSEVGVLWRDIEKGLREQAARLRSDLVLSQKENRELQERLMVSEATVQAQAEQLKDYRDLLTETSVQQASKQVQVDLQDLGYETCGRSENEAEREDTSSPEFDDLEMCTALSHHQDSESVGSGWYPGNCSHNSGAYETQDGSASLQHLVQDLRSQLTRCHKVIRGLQLRVRSLSATSDYASSLERTPRKVNWAFETSPAPSGAEEDEGWMSDPQGMRSSSRPSRELQELMERVATLEAQLKGSKMEGKEEGKCATWPGKYNSLIQAQARELSHLRQRMREGQGVCHILTQHLGDTTKGFEELLRANDIDYYMGQSFREQLAQSTALAQRVIIKISGRERAESHDDKTGHELLALRLSKELQQKDKLIESLHSKLQQRPETPSSCHALSETTDQSDRTSLVSDEYQTNEDVELCSDLDAREFQEDHRLHQQRHTTESDVCSSLPPPHGFLKSSSSCPNMLCSATVGLTSQSARALFSVPVSSSLSVPSGPDVWGYEVSSDPRPRALSVIAVRPELDSLYKQMSEQNRVYGVAQEKSPFSLSPSAHNQHDLSSYSQLSHHAFQQYQLGGIPEGHSIKSDSGLVTGRPLWDVENFVQPFGSYSGNQPGSSPAGVNLIEEHLWEIRNLRQRLEESIRTNERLRQQLEEKVASAGRDGGAPTNIYIQGLDTVTQLSNEIRVLKEENLGLQSRLQASTDTNEEMVQLREAVFAARARLKQAELEAEQWKEELRRLQAHSQEQGQQIHTLRQERQAGQEKSNRLQHEVSLLQQQLCESRELIHSLQSELHVYDRVCSSAKANKGYLCEVAGLPVELSELLAEVRSLRAQLQSSVQENSALKQLELHKQLEQKLGVASPRTPSLSALTASPQRENFYRRQLLHDPAPSPPVRDIGLFNCGSPGPPYSDLEDSHSTANADPLDPHSELEGEAPDGSFANRNGRHAIGHVDDFSALQQQILEGRSLIQRMEATLQACLTPPLLEGNQKDSSDLVLDYGCVKSLLSNTKTLRQILEEAMSLLKMFWRAALPSTDPSIQNLKKEHCMQEEILSLKLRISEQEEVLKGTIQRLRSTSRTKESMEHFIVNQLSRTRDVLRKARTNLEKNELRLSSLSSSSSSPYAAEDPGGAARELVTDRSVLKMSCASGVAVMAANQRMATRKRSSQCLL